MKTIFLKNLLVASMLVAAGQAVQASTTQELFPEEKIAREKAQELLEKAKAFREKSKMIGDYLYPNWSTLTPEQRQSLRDSEVAYLNKSTTYVTCAVDMVLKGTSSCQ